MSLERRLSLGLVVFRIGIEDGRAHELFDVCLQGWWLGAISGEVAWPLTSEAGLFWIFSDGRCLSRRPIKLQGGVRRHRMNWERGCRGHHQWLCANGHWYGRPSCEFSGPYLASTLLESPEILVDEQTLMG